MSIDECASEPVFGAIRSSAVTAQYAVFLTSAPRLCSYIVCANRNCVLVDVGIDSILAEWHRTSC